MQPELQICIELLRGSCTRRTSGDLPPIPGELADTYERVLAARKLGRLSLSAAGVAALCRAALTSSEDDRVRVEALQQLINARSAVADTVLFGLLFDDDEEMRLTAIEGFTLVSGADLARAAEVVAHDPSEAVRTLMEQVLNSEDILLYRLDPAPV